MMLIVFWLIFLLGGALGVSLIHAQLNKSRTRLRKLKLPFTFRNMFFLTAHEVEAREKLMHDGDYTILKEVFGQKLFDEMLKQTLEGLSWQEAAQVVLLRDNKQTDRSNRSKMIERIRIKQ